MDDQRSRPQPGDETVAAIVSQRVQAITQAAERAALAVNEGLEAQRRDAELQVARYFAESQALADRQVEQRLRRLEELSGDVLARAERVIADLDALAAALRKAQAATPPMTPPSPPWSEEREAPSQRAPRLGDAPLSPERPMPPSMPRLDVAVPPAQTAAERAAAALDAPPPPPRPAVPRAEEAIPESTPLAPVPDAPDPFPTRTDPFPAPAEHSDVPPAAGAEDDGSGTVMPGGWTSKPRRRLRRGG